MSRAFDAGAPAVAAASSVRMEPTPPFVLAWSGGWVVVGGSVVPMLVRHPVAAGINGVFDKDIQRKLDGKLNYTQAFAAVRRGVERRGQVWLDPFTGPGGAAYIDVHENAQGASVHLAPWETPIPGGLNARIDVAELKRWIVFWVEAGTLPASPMEGTIDAKLQEIDSVLDRCRMQHGGTESSRFKAYTAERAAWAAMLPSAPAEVVSVVAEVVSVVAAPKGHKPKKQFDADEATSSSSPAPAPDADFGA